MVDDSLFDDPDLRHGPDPSERRAVRRQVLGGILRVIRGRNAWSVNDAASAASIAPMTWRRLEDGLDVRKRTLTALDSLLGQPFGTVRRALDDDLVMVSLTGLAEVDTAAVDLDDASGFLDALAERFRSGTADHAVREPREPRGRASANLGGLTTARPAPVAGPVRFTAQSLGVPPGELLATLASAWTPRSDITIAAELADRLLRRPVLSETLEHLAATILAALPDLVTDSVADAAPAVEVLVKSGHPTLRQAAAEVAELATDRALQR